jgi:uncharacterized protein YhhL (DUF1145 family)
VHEAVLACALGIVLALCVFLGRREPIRLTARGFLSGFLIFVVLGIIVSNLIVPFSRPHGEVAMGLSVLLGVAGVAVLSGRETDKTRTARLCACTLATWIAFFLIGK